MTLNSKQMEIVARYARMVMVSSLKAGNKPVEAQTDAAIAAERAYARFQRKNYEALQAAMNDSMLGQVRWS